MSHNILDFTKCLKANYLKILHSSNSLEFYFQRAIVNCHNVKKTELPTITTLSFLCIEYVLVLCESYPLLQYTFEKKKKMFFPGGEKT